MNSTNKYTLPLAGFLIMAMTNIALASHFNSAQLIIKTKPGMSVPSSIFIQNSKNLFENVYVVRTNNIAALEKSLKNNSTIQYMERNSRSNRRELPKTSNVIPGALQLKTFENNIFNDPLNENLWSFKDANENGISVNSAYRSHATSATKSIIVAVIDTGIDIEHEDLKDVLWTNHNEIPGNGIDDDNNGYIDDVHGINTVVRYTLSGHATGDVRDAHSHGTHVSGTIGAKQNNGKGIAGIASNVKIMAIRAIPDKGEETDVDIAESFIYAAKNGARIINCSFGKSTNENGKLITDTLNYIADRYGVLVVVSSGNAADDIDLHPVTPASFKSENILVVASTSIDGKISFTSNYGKISVDLAAPGNNILSTIPGNKYQFMSGTSMAAPAVAAVAAEILSHYPKLTYRQLKSILINSVTRVDGFQTKMVSGGRVDLLRSLDLARRIK